MILEGFQIVDLNLSEEFLDRTRKALQTHAHHNWKQEDHYHYNDSPRLFNLWREVPEVKEIAVHSHLRACLSSLYFGLDCIPFQTINFLKGSEQPLHSDSIHFDTFPPGWSCGVWVALEDITENNGGLRVCPGTHLQYNPPHTLQSFGIPVPCSDTVGDAYHSYEREIAKLQPRWKDCVPMKAGQAVVFRSGLLHGGAPILDLQSTRFSQVTHYVFGWGTQLYCPLFSDVAARKIAYKDVLFKAVL